jgi:hypothetical protein
MTTVPLLFLVAQSLTWQQAGPVLDRWCNDCHRPGQVGPFDFTSYDGASAYAPEIARYLLAKKMPPWRAKPGPVEWANSRRIPDRSIALLLNWMNQGARDGAPPAMRKRHPQWNLGAPDLVVSQPKEHVVSGEKTVEIVTFSIPANELGTVSADRYVQGIEFRPSNRNLLHHAVLRSGGKPVAAWSMTDTGLRLPPGVAWKLPRGQSLEVELHYFKRNLRPAYDLTRLALYFAKAKPRREAFLLEATKPDIRIPAGANLHRERTQFTLPETVQLHAILPVFQLLAHSVRLRLTGQADWTLWIEPYEHHLVSSYAVARALPLARGAKLELEAVYDNSTQNEFNPHKTLREVISAENGLDETFLFWLTVSKPISVR